MMNKALIIKKPWIDKILDNGKRWEMRTMPTKVRGKILLIEGGSGMIVGEAELVSSRTTPIAKEEAFIFQSEHQVEDLELLEKWCYPWVLKNARRYERPVPYKHPKGAVIWVNFK